MTKAELIEKTMNDARITKAQAGRAVDAVFNAVKETVAAGDTITIPKFGTFSAADVKERQGRNPQTGEAITMPAHKRVKFKASAKFTDTINTKEA